MHTTPQNSVITGVVVAASIGDSDAIVFKGFTKGVMILQADASSPTTTVNYYVSSTEDGTYYELKKLFWCCFGYSCSRKSVAASFRT